MIDAVNKSKKNGQGLHFIIVCNEAGIFDAFNLVMDLLSGRRKIAVQDNTVKDSLLIIITDQGVSVGELSAPKTFIICPNPNNGQFELKVEAAENSEYTWEIFDATGRSIMKEDKKSIIGNNTQQINLTTVHPGSYLLILRSGNDVSRKMFIVR